MEGFATMIRRQYRRGLMTKLEYENELGLITHDELIAEIRRLKLRGRRPRTPRVARKYR
jgi:hypothetical protein